MAHGDSRAVGKPHWQLLQPASAGDRLLTSKRQSFLSPLTGLFSFSASIPYGSRHGPHSAAATRLPSPALASLSHGLRLWVITVAGADPRSMGSAISQRHNLAADLGVDRQVETCGYSQLASDEARRHCSALPAIFNIDESCAVVKSRGPWSAGPRYLAAPARKSPRPFSYLR